MKQTINVGAYGWLHPHWLKSYYPEDLPAGWRLGYYSNEFNTVLVPASYWQEQHMADCEALLDDVHPEFQFFIECDEKLLGNFSMHEFVGSLELLKPQLSGLVFVAGLRQKRSPGERFYELAESLDIDLIGNQLPAGSTEESSKKLWQPDTVMLTGQPPRFAIVDDDLRDLRAVRTKIEPFASQLQQDGAAEEVATMIIRHPQLQATDLGKLRSVLEIMGY